MKQVLSIAALTALACILALAQDKPAPSTAGLYYSSPSGPSRLELATSSGFKAGGSAVFGKVKGRWLYRNPAAITQLSDHHPIFILVCLMDVSTQAVTLLRLDVKKDLTAGEYLLMTNGPYTGVGYDFGVK
jgi:hypothetical protein